MADYKGFVPSRKYNDSTDVMREKLEKWRRMKGRRSTCQAATTVYNRSKSAVTLHLRKDTSVLRRSSSALSTVFAVKNKGLKKKDIKGPQTCDQPKLQTGYKRFSDSSEDLIDVKKRRGTFVVDMNTTSPTNSRREKATCPNDLPLNVVVGNVKTPKDKSLSMSERLQLWRAEKRKSNLNKPADKSKQGVTKMERKSCFKENKPHYHKLEADIGKFCTPDNTKPVSRAQTKSTIKKTRFVTPHSHKHSVTQPNSAVMQSKKKPAKKYDLVTSIAAESSKDIYEADNAKSYQDKALGMRERLDLWLAEKGKTPKYKTPALMKSFTSLQQRNVHEKKRLSFNNASNDKQPEQLYAISSPGKGENIEEKIQECLMQLDREECDSEKVAAKLDLFNCSCPHTAQIANYWLCRAKIALQEHDYDRVVCLFEQALVFKAQPEPSIKDAVCDFVQFMKENGNRDEVSDGICDLPESSAKQPSTDERDNSLEELNSSIIKFCLTEATPYRKRFKAAYGKSVLTPVRRSVRLECISTQHPSVLHEHDLTVRTLDELPEDVQQNLLFKPNFAVCAELNEAWYELQLD